MDQQESTPKRARRKSPKGKRRGRYTGSVAFHNELAVLRGQGVSQDTVGKLLGVDQSTVARVEKRPEVQAKIAYARTVWRIVALTRMNEMAESMWDVVEGAIDSEDAKAVKDSTGVSAEPSTHTPRGQFAETRPRG